MTPVPLRRPPVRQWYRDPVSCLQSTVATLLLDAGQEPLEALGLSWEFRWIPGDVRPEEYYLPCRKAGDLVGSLLPYHPVSSTWRNADPADPLRALEEALVQGRLPVVAVDNYHLPFRPAFQDVHAAHLLVVYEVDREAGTVGVSDAMPPAFLGPLPIDDLLHGWGSGLPPDEQDAFFSGGGANTRWLDVHMDLPFPPLTRERLGEAMRTNLRGWTDGGELGAAALDRFGTDLVMTARSGDGAALAKAYTFGWSMQAQAALHGELLRRCGAAWNLPDLAEAGRMVERVAHRWTAVRVTAAHGRTALREAGAALPAHVRALSRAYQEAMESVDRAVITETGQARRSLHDE